MATWTAIIWEQAAIAIFNGTIQALSKGYTGASAPLFP